MCCCALWKEDGIVCAMCSSRHEASLSHHFARDLAGLGRLKRSQPVVEVGSTIKAAAHISGRRDLTQRGLRLAYTDDLSDGGM